MKIQKECVVHPEGERDDSAIPLPFFRDGHSSRQQSGKVGAGKTLTLISCQARSTAFRKRIDVNPQGGFAGTQPVPRDRQYCEMRAVGKRKEGTMGVGA